MIHQSDEPQNKESMLQVLRMRLELPPGMQLIDYTYTHQDKVTGSEYSAMYPSLNIEFEEVCAAANVWVAAACSSRLVCLSAA